MAKNAKFDIEIGTDKALRDIQEVSSAAEKLNKNLENMGKKANEVGKAVGGIGGQNIIDPAEVKGVDSEQLDAIKNLTRTISELSNTVEKMKTPKDPATPTQPPTQPPTPKPNEPTNQLGKLLGTATLGMFMRNYVMPGARMAREGDSTALDIYARTGDYGSDFTSARKNAQRMGAMYGYDTQQSMNLQDVLMSTAGFGNRDDLNRDTQNVMRFTKTYGLQNETIGSLFGEQVQKGTFNAGEADKFANILASSIETNNMTGREEEQIRALMGIQDILTDGKLNVTSEDFKNVASLQASLAGVNKNLRGDRGAEMLAQAGSMVNPREEMWLRLAGYGSQLGTGVEARERAVQLAYEGFSNEEFKKNMLENMPLYGMTPGSSMERLMVSEKSGMSPNEAGAFLEALRNGDPKAISELETQRKKDLEKNVMDSRALMREEYDVKKRDAQTNLGDKLNQFTAPLEEFFNKLPEGLRTGVSGGVEVGKYALTGGAMAKGANILLGGGKFPSLGDLFSGAGKAGEVAGSTTLSKLGPVITTAYHGLDAYGHYSKGENKEGAGAIGAGVGTLGGMKLGAVAGSAGGPIGTIIGGVVGAVVGSISGDFMGQGMHDLLDSTTDANKDFKNTLTKMYEIQRKEENVLNKQEQLINKQERLLEKDKAVPSRTPNARTGGNTRRLETDASIATNRETVSGATPANGDYLGAATSTFEASNAGFISSGVGDPNGGKSYGLPQFSTVQGSADTFRKEAISNSSFAKFFEGAGKAGTGSFDAAWKNAYNSDPEGFARLQTSYNYKNRILPFINRVQEKTGVNLGETRALQELAYSTATQYGAYNTGAIGDINPNMSEEEIIKFVQQNKANKHSSLFKTLYKDAYVNKNLNSQNVYQNILNKRIPNEEKSLLDFVGQAPLMGYAVGTDYIPKDQLAYVHKEEAILNKHEAENYRQGKFKKDLKDGQLERIREAEQQIRDLGNVAQSSPQGGDINLNLTIEGRNADEELVNRVHTMIKQAIARVENNKIKLNTSFQRTAN